MKKTICVAICIVLITLLFAGCNELTPTDKKVVVKQSLDFNLANHLQFKGYMTLNAFEEKLYFTEVVSDKNGTVGSLSVFSNGGIEEIRHWDNVSFIGFYDEYLYYFQDNTTEYMDDEYMNDVYCYSLKTQEEKFLTTVKMLKDYSVWWFEGGTLYIPTNFFSHNENKEIEYRLIVGDEVKETLKTELVYQVGDRNYTLKGFDNEYVYCISNGERQNMRDVIGVGDKSLIPCETGLLVYNQTHENLLYFIDDKTGEVHNLFEIECMSSVSAVNIYENYVFLSFKRYEKWGGFPEKMLEYKNDTVQGTYRIDLNDGSSTKISDEIYDALYIFGEGIIYATDSEGQIFKLDFDGNVTENLLVE